jgi:hypothetical protein
MDPTRKQLIESVFAGGGEMGERMRAVDWSTTVLGPVERWPQSLRACVRIVLGSGYPMLISWGADYTMLYNDAYGVVVGTKHPGALGRSCREVLAEAWDYIGPLFDAVFTQGQPFTGSLNRCVSRRDIGRHSLVLCFINDDDRRRT